MKSLLSALPLSISLSFTGHPDGCNWVCLSLLFLPTQLQNPRGDIFVVFWLAGTARGKIDLKLTLQLYFSKHLSVMMLFIFQKYLHFAVDLLLGLHASNAKNNIYEQKCLSHKEYCYSAPFEVIPYTEELFSPHW